MVRFFKKSLGFILLVFLLLCYECLSVFAEVEFSANIAYSQSNYGTSGYSWTKRWGVSGGYYIGSFSEIQLSFQEILYRTKIDGVGDTTFHDQIYSAEWI